MESPLVSVSEASANASYRSRTPAPREASVRAGLRWLIRSFPTQPTNTGQARYCRSESAETASCVP
jgi:hypothetical protein